MEFRRKKAYHIIIQQKDLVTNIEEYVKILDKYGKYFYIYHYKYGVQPHYHIYYCHNSSIDEIEAEDLAFNNLVKQAFVHETMGKNPTLLYMLQNGKYALSDIVSTIPLR